MKKTLIALALTALPVASMADVILYGQIKGGVEVVKEKNVKGTTTSIVDYGSRIGFKGHEHLTDNLQAIWQLEQSVNIGGKPTSFGTRDSFIGLKSNAGTVKVGYQQTPVAELNGTLDIWEYSDAAAGLGQFTRDNAATGRKLSVSYETPDLAGFSAKAYVAPSENSNGEKSGLRNNKDKATYGLSASYKNSGFFADVAGAYVKGTEQAIAKGKKAGYQALAQVGYDANDVLVGVAYQQARYVDDALAAKSQEVAVTGAYTVNNALRLKATGAYGFNLKDADGAKVFTNGKYYQGIVGADYALSKRTELNGQVGYVSYGKKDDKARSGVVSVGMKHAF